MKLRSLSLTAALGLAFAPGVGAAGAAPAAGVAPAASAAPAGDALSYDDPGMHFKPPDGWTRLQIAERDASSGDADAAAPVAAYAWHPGQTEQRTILITIKPFSGTLAGLESQHESDLRSGTGTTFVDKRTQSTLSNGMPMYVVRVSQGSDAGKFVRRYDYLIFDGERGIDVAFIGRQGDFDEKDVGAALGSLYVVAYPRRRS